MEKKTIALFELKKHNYLLWIPGPGKSGTVIDMLLKVEIRITKRYLRPEQD